MAIVRSSRVWSRLHIYENETVRYLFRGEEQYQVIVIPPPCHSSRVARHSLVTSGLYSRKNIRGKTGERGGGRWNFDGKAVSYISSGN